MKTLVTRLLLTIVMCSVPRVAIPQSAANAPASPSAFISKLYREVILYRPLGYLDYEYTGNPTRKIVEGTAARRRFTPYITQSLRHRIDQRDACLKDWLRQFPDPNLKPPIFEGGIFSGGDEYGEPQRFHIEKIQSLPDGTLNAFVSLSGELDPPAWSSWRVELILIRDGGRLGVNDVIYLSNDARQNEKLTEILSSGCKDSRWVGDRPH